MGKKKDQDVKSKRERSVSPDFGPKVMKRPRKSSDTMSRNKLVEISSVTSTEQECELCRKKFSSSLFKRHQGSSHDFKCLAPECDYK